MTHLSLVPEPATERASSDSRPSVPQPVGHGFVNYLVRRVYLWPAGEPRSWRAGLFAQRLGLAADKVVDLGSVGRKPSAAAGWLRRALDQAWKRGDARILVLRDDLVFHRHLDRRLEALLGDGGIGRSCVLGAGAQLVERADFRALGRALSRGVHEPGLDAALARLPSDEPTGEDRGLVCPRHQLAEMTEGERAQYLGEGTMRRITACCATRRPEFLDNVLRNIGRQSYPNRELVLVLDGWRAPTDLAARARRVGVEHLKVIERPAGETLGDCLNAGIATSEGAYWCKIDDDDFYDRDYLLEAWEHLTMLGVDIVGKPRFHVFFPRLHQGCTTTDREYARLDFRRHNGGTLFTTRALIARLGFAPLDLGEDLELYRTAASEGLQLGDTSLANYVYIRHGDNTSDFERHLSVPWDLDASPLYRRLVREHTAFDGAAGARPELGRLELADLRRFVCRMVAPRQRRRRIPKILHQIWIGPEPMPSRWMATWQRDFLARHPDWEYRLWTDAEVADFELVHHPAYRRLSYCGRADLLRYRILECHGGVFVDADSAYLGAAAGPHDVRPSLDRLIARHDGCGLVMAQEPFRRGEPPLVAVGVMASVRGNPLLEVFIERGLAAVEECLARGGHLQAWETTGPRMVTEVLDAVGLTELLPAHVFYPEYWDTTEHWHRPLEELARAYPRSLMFQFGYSTNQLQALEGGAITALEAGLAGAVR